MKKFVLNYDEKNNDLAVSIAEKIVDYNREQVERRKEFSELFARYKALCVMSGENGQTQGIL